jgi:hypothetical protein
MTTIRFIGDVHGHFARYETILKNSPYPTIQVGDMGIGFRRWPHGELSSNPPYDKMVAGGHRFIRGNHDNPAVCGKHSQYVSDGTMMNGLMFVGGALSIDKVQRVEGYSYWPDEELSIQKLNHLVTQFEVMEPTIMVTHECPDTIAELVVNEGRATSIKLDPRFASRTRQAFQSMFELYQPKLWIFGHWHVPFDKVINGTRFVCLPELATMDVDTENL